MKQHDINTAGYYNYYGYYRHYDNPFSSISAVSSRETHSEILQYLGKVLPAAVFGLLVVYYLKDVNVFSGSHGLPELISVIAVIALHCWKRQMLLSIAGGTICYMLLVQLLF